MPPPPTPHHGRLIAASTLWQIGSQLAMAALSIITVKFVAIGLSRELAGSYNSVYGYLQIFGILADFGLYAVAVREISKAEHKEDVMGALILLRALITLLSLSAAVLVAWILPAWRGSPLPAGIAIAAFVPFFTLLAGIQRTIFQVGFRMHYVFVAEVLQRIVSLLLIGAVIAAGVRGSTDSSIYELFLLAGSVGALVLFLLSTFFARRLLRPRFAWNASLLKKLLRQAAPFGLAFLCTALYRQTDVTLIALLRPDYELQNAYYGFALRAVEMGYLFPTYLLNSMLPVLTEREGKGEDTRGFAGTVLAAILLVSVTLFLTALLWARPLMLLLTRSAYVTGPGVPAGADTALSLLALPMFLNGIILFAFYLLLARHAWKPLVAVLAGGAVLSLALNILLIPRFGFVGAGITAIAVHAALAAVLLPVSRRVLPFTVRRGLLLRWALYALLLAAFLVLTRPLLTSSLATIGMGVLFLLYVGAVLWLTGIGRALMPRP